MLLKFFEHAVLIAHAFYHDCDIKHAYYDLKDLFCGLFNQIYENLHLRKLLYFKVTIFVGTDV